MNWSPEADELKTHVNGKIPFFVRGFVDKTITRTAESIAQERNKTCVETADVVNAFLVNTPKAMTGLMAKSMREKGIDPGAFGYAATNDGPEFPIGEAMSPDEIAAFLTRAVTGRLGSCLAGKPYVVPLSFVYLQGKLYYHWFSYGGRKIENIEGNSRVCFEADEYTRDHLNYASVIADGVISKVSDKSEKEIVMRELARKFPEYATGAGHNAEIQGIVDKGFEAMVAAVEVYRIDIDTVTGKKKGQLS